jgi:glycerate-2-kinase
MTQKETKKIFQKLFYSALKAVDPYAAVKQHEKKILDFFASSDSKKITSVAFGKAACSMAKGAEELLGDIITQGIIITKYGHCSERDSLKKMTVFEAGHPVPDAEGVRGTEEVVKRLQKRDDKTAVLCLISGGGSALLVSPLEGISLDDKQKTTHLLLSSGADIHELNTVRKHISKVKGGRLAQIAFPSPVISLILSDVIGDNLDVIASGPTSPDSSTYHDAVQVIRKYGLEDKIPRNILDVLHKGKKGLVPETPKDEDPVFQHTKNIIIGSNRIAIDEVKRTAYEIGFDVILLSTEMKGEARDMGKWLGLKAREMKNRIRKPMCLLSGGETTVTVRGNGKGGRNAELALAFALEIEGLEGVSLLSAGTDGNDGPTDAAGAIADGKTIAGAREKGLDPQQFLDNNDSYTFFKKTGGLFITGPTGTNVMDLQIVILR